MTWQLDNPDWVKDRKQQWKEVKKKLDHCFYVNAKEKRSLKSFFLEGQEDPEYPIDKMQHPVLLRVWLDADSSIEHWKEIRTQYDSRRWGSDRNAFPQTGWTLGECPDGESFYNGLEEKMATFFCWHRLSPEDWEEYDETKFLRLAKKGLAIQRDFGAYLMHDVKNPYDSCLFQVQYWRDAMTFAFHEGDFEWDFLHMDKLVARVKDVLDHPRDNDDHVVVFCEELEEAFNAPEWPREARDLIQTYKQKCDS